VSKGTMVVQARPESPEALERFDRWYDEVHIPELLTVEGFVSARRLRAADGESFLTIYEVHDVAAAQSALAAARTAGGMTPPDGLQLDPPPSVQWFEDLGG
jgi:hypothetical protein